MTNGERTAAGIGLGILALALLPQSARSTLLDGFFKLVEGTVTHAKKLPALESADEVWEDIDVSEWTVH